MSDSENQIILGIDDAGRGPVIGPMFLTGVVLDKEKESKLKELGVTDSKALTRKKRENLSKTIKETCIAYQAELATPAEIDTGMGQGLNLNQVEAMLASIIITKLSSKLSPNQKKNLRIVIDCPSNNTDGWKKQLIEYIKDNKLNISCEHKADVKHISVAAASIISKVSRDDEIKKLHKKIGKDFGSGYPNDPKTKKFLTTHHNNPEYKRLHLFRETWATYQKAVNKKSQMKLPDY